MKVSALREILVAVEDLDEVSRWYCETFGLARLADSRDVSGMPEPPDRPGPARGGGPGEGTRPDRMARARHLARRGGPPTPRLCLLEVAGPARPARARRDLQSPGPVGFGCTTPDIHAEARRLRDAGAEPVSDPMCLSGDDGAMGPDPARWESFVRLSGGEYAVLIQRDRAPAPYGTFSQNQPLSEPVHASFVVADLERALRFYTEVLGHQTIVQEHCAGPVFEQLMALETGTSFDFVMVKAPDEATGRVVLMAYPPAPKRQDAPFSGPPSGSWSETGRTGIAGLRYETDDLDTLVARAAACGFDPLPFSSGVPLPYTGAVGTALFDAGLGCPLAVDLA